jgi:hypothetical protein
MTSASRSRPWISECHGIGNVDYVQAGVVYVCMKYGDTIIAFGIRFSGASLLASLDFDRCRWRSPCAENTSALVLRAQRANACVRGTRAFSRSFQSHNTSPDGGARTQRCRPAWSLPSTDSSSPKSLTACLLFLNFMPRGKRCSWTM